MKRKVSICLFCYLLILYKTGKTQLEANHWMFSPSYYVSFFSGTTPDTIRYPTLSGGFFLGRGSVSYSDRNGNLLFFGGSFGRIFDKNFNVFPSTDFVFPGVPLYGTAYNNVVSQPMLAIPYPGHDSLFIIFHIRITETLVSGQLLYTSSLYYSVINMNLRNGLGEVVPGQKNILLLNGAEVGYKLTAILHCNKKHIWVTGHLQDSDKYFSLLVTENGVSTTPVYFTGTYIPKRSVVNNTIYDLINNNGCIKASALGNKLAAAFMGMGFTELMDFNIQTGIGSNLKILSTVPPPADTSFFEWNIWHTGPYGIDFSPSGEKLYISSSYHLRNANHNNLATYLNQFDASLPTAVQIQNSKYLVTLQDEKDAGAIQIGNNGKMYLNLTDDLHEIANPEGSGAVCNYNGVAVHSGSAFKNLNLPTFLQSYFRYPIIATGNCQFQNISFSIQNPVGISSVFWNFGDPLSGPNNTSNSFTPTHIFTSQGAFTVTAVLQNANGCGTDTIRKIVYTGPFRIFLGNDVTICQGDTLKLRMNIPNANNLWSTGSRDTAIYITQSGTYWVRTNIGDCFASDTINITVKQLPIFTLGNDSTICSDQSIVLAPSPNPSNVSHQWNTGATTQSINTISDGLYWLQVTENEFGCIFRDSINVQFKTLPNYTLGPDISICEKDTATLNATVASATGYLWNTGATTPFVKVYQTGIYWADVSKDGCTFRDSILINVKPLPVVNLGNDTTLCEDVTLVLDAGNTVSQYLWQNNSTSQYFTVSGPGTYYVRKMMNGCISSDTIKISYDFKPAFTLGDRIPICDGQTIQLQPRIKRGNSGISYLWSNGSTMSSISISSPGTYSLELTNYCGTRANEVVVYRGVCKIYVPGAFTPNNDGKNDIFKAMFGENIIKYTLEIYNRWGQKIFQTTNLNQGWDGTYKGLLQPNDSYIWIIRYKAFNDNHDQLLKGIVNLVR